MCMFLSLNMNSKYKIFTYKSTMWADASGYYVYLPATFIYQWDVNSMESGIDTLTGRGFEIQRDKNKLFSKYTSGISYLQLPFFAAAHLYTKITNGKSDGFSQNYVNALLFSGVFYFLLALFCLFYFLGFYFSKTTSLLTCIALALCTNLYYYGIEHPGLTHIYSFFLISFSLLLIKRGHPKIDIILMPIFALLLLIRPTNFVVILALIVIYVYLNQTTLKDIRLKNILIGVAIGIALILPQMFYWHWVNGSCVMYSYKNEGFTNWHHPYILEVLFAACNGFFTYAPIFILSFIGFKYYPINKLVTMVCLVSFVSILYLNASWWCWPFGCAYGARAFIEYYPFLALGLAAFLEHFKDKKSFVYTTLLLFAILNMRLLYNYDDCFYGDTWDYNVIIDLLF